MSIPTRLTSVIAIGFTMAITTPFAWTSDVTVSFNADIQHILSNRCFKCHGPDHRARKRRPRLDTFEGATHPARSGLTPIVPGDVAASELIRRVSSTNPDYRMPPPSQGAALSREDVATLRRWIAQGARYEPRWSYIPPVRAALPKLESDWPRNPIDAFVLDRLNTEGLTPSPEADAYTLVRRVYLDLTGLPPDPETADRFAANRSPSAYEDLVDALLDSPRYGEHWATKWLDLARYADTKGYEKDEPRTIWPYRDWVIDALNSDMPYDQFTIEQIAGDLLPDPSRDQRIATAFHRNTMTNDEGGTDDEEFRSAAVVDRLNTTFQTWMATTINCAQCHDHKYDPISQKEFYEAYAFFNQTADNDQPNESPVVPLATDKERERLDHLHEKIADLERTIENTTEPEAKTENLKRLEQLRKRWDEYAATTLNVPVMEELPESERRDTHMHIRGSFLNPGKQVEPGTPEAFHTFKEDWPRNRLGFAYWLTDRDNPLTARVAVNRHWEALFGAGLVTTSEEFGTQGDLPSHPGLLDWLAIEFIDTGWSLKRLCKTIVMSATYRQSSRLTPELQDRDPLNRLLARGPRVRLDAEVLRDSALAVSGLLSDKMHGPPVMPPQPDGVWNVVYSSRTWVESSGEDRYRRGLYTYWRRTSPYPSMISFDAGSREVCTVRRIRTNTPLQALVLLNDPVYVEAAQALARRILFADLDSDEARVAYAFKLVLARPASDQEIDRVLRLYADERRHFNTRNDDTVQMATNPLGPLWRGDFYEVAAWSVVANVLLNLDEFITNH